MLLITMQACNENIMIKAQQAVQLRSLSDALQRLCQTCNINYYFPSVLFAMSTFCTVFSTWFWITDENIGKVCLNIIHFVNAAHKPDAQLFVLLFS